MILGGKYKSYWMFCVIREGNMEGKTLIAIGLGYMLILSIFSGCIDNNPLPVVTISANQVTGYQPLEVSFTLDAVPDESIQSYYWDFGDGKTSTQKNPTHIFEDDGSYTVIVMVTDETGRVVNKFINIFIIESIELKINNIIGSSEDNKLTTMIISVKPMIGHGKNHSRNLQNITIDLNVLDEYASLNYNGTFFYYWEIPGGSNDPILYDLEDNEFGIAVIQDNDGACTKNSPVVNYGDTVFLTVNLSACLGGVPPRTFVNGTVGNTLGVFDGIIHFVTPSNLTYWTGEEWIGWGGDLQ